MIVLSTCKVSIMLLSQISSLLSVCALKILSVLSVMITKAGLALKSQDQCISFPDLVFSNQVCVHVCLSFK